MFALLSMSAILGLLMIRILVIVRLMSRENGFESYAQHGLV